MLGKYIKHFTDILGNKSKLKLHNHLSFVEIDKELPIMWLFPYFMESLIKAVLPSLTMLDYKVTANSVSPRISPRGVLIFGLKMTLSLFPFETKMRLKNKKKPNRKLLFGELEGIGGDAYLKGGPYYKF